MLLGLVLDFIATGDEMTRNELRVKAIIIIIIPFNNYRGCWCPSGKVKQSYLFCMQAKEWEMIDHDCC